MALADLRVDELVLQVPGLSRDEGGRLARLVRERLALMAVTGPLPAFAGAVRLTLDASGSEPLEDLAERIVTALAARLGGHV